jgi:hypothetical protein
LGTTLRRSHTSAHAYSIRRLRNSRLHLSGTHAQRVRIRFAALWEGHSSKHTSGQANQHGRSGAKAHMSIAAAE